MANKPDAADFSPTMSQYSGIGKFKAWVQMVLPQVYDDALSYQELVYKMLFYINTLIDDVDNAEGNVTALKEAYDSLQAYINSWFADLDVQEEVKNILDEYVEDGTLGELIEQLFTAYQDAIDAVIQDQNNDIDVLESRLDAIEALPDGSTTADAELTDIRVGYNGFTYASAGTAVRQQIAPLAETCYRHIYNSEMYQAYLNYSNGAVDTTRNDGVCTGFIPMADFVEVNKPQGIQMRYAFYNANDGTGFIHGYSASYSNAQLMNKTSTNFAANPTAKYVLFCFMIRDVENSSYVEPVTPADITTAGAYTQIGRGSDIDNISEYVRTYSSENFNFTGVLIASKTFTIDTIRPENIIVNVKAKWTGTTAPTIQAVRSWNDYLDASTEYYKSPKYVIGDSAQYKFQQLRFPGYITGMSAMTFTITVPSGTTVDVQNMYITYSDVKKPADNIRLEAHSQSGICAPFNTLAQIEMAGKLGYDYVIVVPKVTADGIYVCLHDDDSIQATARMSDGTAIPSADQNIPVSEFTYEELLQYDFGIYRGTIWKGEKIPKLEDVCIMCSKLGLHLVLSIHPNLSGHWDNIHTILKKTGIINKVTIKGSYDSIGLQMSELGNEIERYVLINYTKTAAEMVARMLNRATAYSITIPCEIETSFANMDSAYVQTVLAAGYTCSVDQLGNASQEYANMLTALSWGCTAFTVDYIASAGLNW